MVINPIVGVYIPIIRIPIKGGMTIPNIATFDHGTYIFSFHPSFLVFFFPPRFKSEIHQLFGVVFGCETLRDQRHGSRMQGSRTPFGQWLFLVPLKGGR